jgi:hypothetical protein
VCFGAPVREGVRVDSLEPGSKGRILLRTSAGDMEAESVVVCTGAFQRPFRPKAAAPFPHGLLVIDAQGYRNPAALPPGKVLVIGSGQTGCQISEELHEAGREVFLACGRAPWLPRQLGGRDIVSWLGETTFFDMSLDALPSPAARLGANLQVTGARRGGQRPRPGRLTAAVRARRLQPRRPPRRPDPLGVPPRRPWRTAALTAPDRHGTRKHARSWVTSCSQRDPIWLFPVEGVARGSGRGWRGRRVGACGGVEVFRGWEFRHCPPS